MSRILNTDRALEALQHQPGCRHRDERCTCGLIAALEKTPQKTVVLELALRAFDDGFAHGANPKKRRGAHTVDSDTHRHWRAGFEAGKAAYEDAARKYRSEIEL